MLKTDNCKGCSATVRVSSKEIDEMIAGIVNCKKFKITNPDEYLERLNICSECTSLEYGTTCMQCGCIVQIKAIIQKEKCPYPRNSKWSKIQL